MKMRSLLMITLVAAAFATNLLLPLYVWPASGAWDNVYEAIEASSQLTFQIIINPDSGPGDTAPGDSAEYTAGVTRLNSYPNVELFGYVHCNYDTSSGEEINRNVTQWNSWNADPKTGIDGIFFDEIPNEEGTKEGVTFLASLLKTARSTFGVHPFKSIFNPGATPQHIELYDSADYVVVFESEASSYNDAVLENQIPSGNASQSSILIYNFASEGSEGLLEPWLQDMLSAGVGSANILNAGYNEASSNDKPAGIADIASILSSGEGQSGSGGNSSKSVGNVAAMPTPETSSSNSSEPSYNPHDGDRDDDEDYEQEENGKDQDIQEKNGTPEDGGLQDGELQETDD